MTNDEPLAAIEDAGDDVAIVGMACLFPGAPNLAAYWRNIVGKVDATSDPPPEAWDVEVFYDPESDSNDRVYCKRGGFISPIAEFDPLESGVMPRAVEGGEPDQWLALRVAREALADAGYADEIPERRNTAVILGKGTYLNRGNLNVVQRGRMVDQTMQVLETLLPELGREGLDAVRADLKRNLPPFSSDTAPGLIPNIIAGRIANRLDLMGPNYTIDAACASSLVAVDHAMRGLRNREFDLALAGGVHVATPVPTLMLFCQLGALSRREQIRPFDALADGTLLGGGLGMVVLKRLADAKRDGNRIYATLKSVGISSDGRGLGVMAPRPEGEELALRRAYEAAGIDPATVGLIEAHGTGTAVGDVTEVESLKSVFGERRGAFPTCGLGTVKSMIGHAMPAAGIAGLIKTALALHHRALPPTLHVEKPNPKLGLESSPFYLNTETRPWIHGTETPRRAGVNAFGFGGINAHAVLEEVDSEPDNLMPWTSEVVLLAGENRSEVGTRIESLLSRLERADGIALADVALSSNLPRPEGRARLAVVATDLDDLGEKLRDARERLEDPKRRLREARGIYYEEAPLAPEAKLAFVFPGEGSQYLGMLADLAMRFPGVRKRFDLADRIFRGHERGFVPSDFVFARPVFTDEERAEAESRLWQMEGAFEAVLTADWALYELLLRLGVTPDALLGHSTGEYAAMWASGMLLLETDDDVVRFARELNDFYYRQGAKEGVTRSSLVALGAEASVVAKELGDDAEKLFVAMDNCPHQTVVVGDDADVDGFLARVQRRGWIYERLSFDRPYHTPLFSAHAEGLEGFLSAWIQREPTGALYSCTSAGRFPDDVEAARELAKKHWMSPVRFRETVETMYEDGVRVFVEVGPRGNLSGFVGDTLRGRPHLAVAADVSSRPGDTQLNHLVGLLAVQGVPVKLDALYEGRRARRIDLAGPAASEPARRRPMKLELDWIPMDLSRETAAKLRESGALALERAEESASPPMSPMSPVSPVNDEAPPLNGKSPPLPEERAPAPTPVPGSESREVMSTYWATMDQFLSVQQEVMESFLRGGGNAPAAPQVERRPEAPLTDAEPSAPPEPPAPPEPVDTEPVEAEPGPETRPAGVREVLLGIVSERTGYPVDMIGLDLDLEADLGIDSIKRVEILGSLQQQTDLLGENDMEALSGRRTLGEVIRYLEEGEGPRAKRPEALAASPPAPALPFLRSIEEHEPGEKLAARCVLDLDEDLFLRDHALGRRPSTRAPELRGLPVVPMTMGMEMLAEAGLALARENEKKVVGMRDVRAHRFLMLDEDDRLELRITARRLEPGVVKAQVFAASGDAPVVPLIEGTVLLDADYAEPPRAEDFALSAERPSRFTADGLYRELMFHGPLFQGVAAMTRWGEDGAAASLRTLPHDRLFASSPRPALATDAVLLDQPGQVVGFWTGDHLERGYVVFPFQLDALTLHTAPGATSEELECRARIRLVGDELVDSDLEVVEPNGAVVCRFTGWKDRRFDVPGRFLRFVHDPLEEGLTESAPEALEKLREPENGFAVQLDLGGFPSGFFTAHGGLWQKALALLVLGPDERRFWREWKLPPAERFRWLLERLVAKEAVRGYLRKRSGLALTPADVELPVEARERMALERAPATEASGAVAVAVYGVGDDFLAVAGPAGAELDLGLQHRRDQRGESE